LLRNTLGRCGNNFVIAGNILGEFNDEQHTQTDVHQRQHGTPTLHLNQQKTLTSSSGANNKRHEIASFTIYKNNGNHSGITLKNPQVNIENNSL
jgi:hypothetical protein